MFMTQNMYCVVTVPLPQFIVRVVESLSPLVDEVNVPDIILNFYWMLKNMLLKGTLQDTNIWYLNKMCDIKSWKMWEFAVYFNKFSF
jgi:hypothetical protein